MASDVIEAQLHQYEQAAEALRENLQRVMEADARKERRVQALEELVQELLVVYYHQDYVKIGALREELGL